LYFLEAFASLKDREQLELLFLGMYGKGALEVDVPHFWAALVWDQVRSTTQRRACPQMPQATNKTVEDACFVAFCCYFLRF